MKRVLLYIESANGDTSKAMVQDLSHFHRSVFVIERQNKHATVHVLEGKTAHVTIVDTFSEYDRATIVEIATRYLHGDFQRYNWDTERFE